MNLIELYYLHIQEQVIYINCFLLQQFYFMWLFLFVHFLCFVIGCISSYASCAICVNCLWLLRLHIINKVSSSSSSSSSSILRKFSNLELCLVKLHFYFNNIFSRTFHWQDYFIVNFSVCDKSVSVLSVVLSAIYIMWLKLPNMLLENQKLFASSNIPVVFAFSAWSRLYKLLIFGTLHGN